MTRGRDDFYVGYRPQAPRGLAKWLRGTIVALAIAGAVIGFTLASGQSVFSDGIFEFGLDKDFEGELVVDPYPALVIDDTPHLLVERGKAGARESLRELAGSTVRATGQLIYRGEHRMIELSPAEVEVTGAAQAAGSEEIAAGRHELVGEILDSKCYLGVMKPARGKAHRACAALCIRGGIPAMLLVTDERGDTLHLLLTDPAGRPLGKELLDLVAEPVRVVGEISRRNGLWALAAEVEDFERLGGS